MINLVKLNSIIKVFSTALWNLITTSLGWIPKSQKNSENANISFCLLGYIGVQ